MTTKLLKNSTLPSPIIPRVTMAHCTSSILLSGPASSGLSLPDVSFPYLLETSVFYGVNQLSLYNRQQLRLQNKIGLPTVRKGDALWKHMHLFLFLVMLRRKNLMLIWNASTETLFQNLGSILTYAFLGTRPSPASS